MNAAGVKIVSLVCADEREREFTVDFKNVLKAGEKIIFIESEEKSTGVPVRLGKACFAEGLVYGDVIIVKQFLRLNGDVVKDGETLFKKGTFVTDDVLNEAAAAGEYVQTKLKSL